jgi:uncharacterized membrane protein
MLLTALALHLLAAIVWVGGMFFAHMALRPAVQELLQPPQRLPLLKKVLDRFFPWVWLAVILILITGYWVFLGPWQGQAGLYVHLMQGLGLVMVGLFSFIYFFPYRRMGHALDAGDMPAAGVQMTTIRRIIGINLVLGLITCLIAAAKPF